MTPTPRGSLWKRVGCGCLASLVALVLGLVVLEWVLRRNVSSFLGTPAAEWEMYESDGDGSYRLRPGWTGTQTVDGRTTTMTINGLGMRGPAIGPKQPHERRVLVLGDSIVFGHGVADDETFPAQLQHLLRQRSGNGTVTVGNAGVPGYGTRDFVPSFERHRDFGADAVVACTYLGNDFVDDCRLSSEVVDGFLLYGPTARLVRTSTRFRLALRFRTVFLLERFFDRHWPALAFDRAQLQPTPEEVAAEALFPPPAKRFAGLFFDRRAHDALVDQILQRCRDHDAALRRACAPVPVLHVVIPSWWHLDPDVWAAELRRRGEDPTAFEIGLTQRRLLALAHELRLDMIDLTPALRDAPDRDALWLPTDRHLSARGCAAVAAWLAPEVERIPGGR